MEMKPVPGRKTRNVKLDARSVRIFNFTFSRFDSRGFTLIELLVSIAIFAFMTALLMAKYGTFNQSVLLTDLAYDVAITLNTARTYGVSVVSVNATSPLPGQSQFQYAYGVDFVTATASNGNTNQQMVLFADTTANSIYDGSTDTLINTYAIKRGAVISSLCAGVGPGPNCAPVGQLDVTFKRPDPSAVICVSGISDTCGKAYAEITLKGTDGSTRTVSVRQNGQIAVIAN